MLCLTTEVTVILTSRPTYNSQLKVHVERIKLPKYTTMRDLARDQRLCSSGMPYAVEGSLERQLVVGGVTGQWSSGSWAADREYWSP